jgi:DNA polymerase III subunit alpha
MLLVRSYSHHSLLSAVPKIGELIADAKQKGYTSISLTDEDTTSGLVEFYDECKKQKIKPILGSTLRINSVIEQKSNFSIDNNFSKIALLAKNQIGYKKLLELISFYRTKKEKPFYHLDLKDIENLDNLFVVITGNDHEFGINIRAKNYSKAKQILEKYLQKINRKNLLVELLYPIKGEKLKENRELNQELTKTCKELEIKYIASSAPRYLQSQQEESFGVILAIKKQVKLKEISVYRDFSLPSKERLKEIFAYLPEALETQEIEDQINIDISTNYDKNADKAFFPIFKLPQNQNPNQRLTWETYIGLLDRFHPNELDILEWKQKFPYEKLKDLIEFCKNIKPDTSKLLSYPDNYWQTETNSDLQKETIKKLNKKTKTLDKAVDQNSLHTYKTIEDYLTRISYELGIILQKGYANYFLVFGDIMRFCRENGIITNTRGSAAGSLVGYLNEINVLDPLIYNLPFERFLNPYRPSPPDIDGDFADDRRQEVIDYIIQTYGNQNVAQIITFGTMLPKAAVRDVGRVLGVSYSKCDRLSKLIPNAPQGRKTTFKWAFETSQELREVYEKDEESKRMIDISKTIEGNYRHASSHAAGILITPTKLTDYTAVQWDSEHKMFVAQYDMKIAEKVGLVKLDILGITNLAILGNALKIAEKRNNQKIDLLNIDISDKKAFELLSKGRTMGTFQLSGGAMTKYLVDLEPNKVEDLMAMVALYRPGPMANIPEFIKRKRNPKKITYFVPKMQEWMESTYGILVYQEDLLLTALNIAGYDWGEADTLRKGMGKKIQAVIEGQHPKFVEGCVKFGGLTPQKAEEIWQAFLPFGAYGFNKAHAASYGMVAYWTAYMKAQFTVEFMIAYMISERNNLDKIAAAIKECKQMGLAVLPPDINQSFEDFSIDNKKTIRYGLASIKNLGEDVIKYIIEERQKNGQFRTMEEFLDRICIFGGFNKRSLEALILSGSLDKLADNVLKQKELVALT